LWGAVETISIDEAKRQFDVNIFGLAYLTKKIIPIMRKQKSVKIIHMRIVVVSGGFDPIHSGHIAYFKAARSHGDKLVIALNSDAWLENKKGKAFIPFDERKIVIENLTFVDEVIDFEEKPQAKAGWINGGFFVLNYKIFSYIEGDKTMFEKDPMKRLLKDKNLKAFKHDGFWKCMDNLRDKMILEDLFLKKEEVWKT